MFGIDSAVGKQWCARGSCSGIRARVLYQLLTSAGVHESAGESAKRLIPSESVNTTSMRKLGRALAMDSKIVKPVITSTAAIIAVNMQLKIKNGGGGGGVDTAAENGRKH